MFQVLSKRIIMSLTQVSCNKCFGGLQKVYSHHSSELGCDMKFAVFLPPNAKPGHPAPALYWLSGLTCNEQNFITKAGAQKYAAQHGIIIICPDTSPRGLNIPGEDDGWDFGTGAGFYVNATEEKWKTNYRMFSYVTEELPKLVNANFPVIHDNISISGHSMGGHGALVCALKNPGLYRSVSAFAPICNPINCAWGEKAFGGYLGADKETWKQWDACELVQAYNGPPLPILIDQGLEDGFLKDGQLLPDNFVSSCQKSNFPVVLRKQDDYDHSYYFIASFIPDHIDHHAKHLTA